MFLYIIGDQILLWLSTAKHGYITQSCLIEVANAILYKLKTGCQWSLFPVEALFSVKVLTYGAVTIITGNGARAANGNPYGFSYLTTTVLNWTCPTQRIEKEGSHHEHPCQ